MIQPPLQIFQIVKEIHGNVCKCSCACREKERQNDKLKEQQQQQQKENSIQEANDSEVQWTEAAQTIEEKNSQKRQKVTQSNTTNATPSETTNATQTVAINPTLNNSTKATATSETNQTVARNAIPGLTTNTTPAVAANETETVATNTSPNNTENATQPVASNPNPSFETKTTQTVVTNTTQTVATDAIPTVTTSAIPNITKDATPNIKTNATTALTFATNSEPNQTKETTQSNTTNATRTLTTNKIPTVATNTTPGITTKLAIQGATNPNATKNKTTALITSPNSSTAKPTTSKLTMSNMTIISSKSPNATTHPIPTETTNTTTTATSATSTLPQVDPVFKAKVANLLNRLKMQLYRLKEEEKQRKEGNGRSATMTIINDNKNGQQKEEAEKTVEEKGHRKGKGEERNESKATEKKNREMITVKEEGGESGATRTRDGNFTTIEYGMNNKDNKIAKDSNYTTIEGRTNETKKNITGRLSTVEREDEAANAKTVMKDANVTTVEDGENGTKKVKDGKWTTFVEEITNGTTLNNGSNTNTAKIYDGNKITVTNEETVGRKENGEKESKMVKNIIEEINEVKMEEISKNSTVEPKEMSKNSTVEPKEMSKNNTVQAEETSKNNTVEAEETSKNNTVQVEETSKNNTVQAEETSKNNTVQAEETSKNNTVQVEETSKNNTVQAEETSKNNTVEEEKKIKSTEEAAIKNNSTEKLTKNNTVETVEDFSTATDTVSPTETTLSPVFKARVANLLNRLKDQLNKMRELQRQSNEMVKSLQNGEIGKSEMPPIPATKTFETNEIEKEAKGDKSQSNKIDREKIANNLTGTVKEEDDEFFSFVTESPSEIEFMEAERVTKVPSTNFSQQMPISPTKRIGKKSRHHQRTKGTGEELFPLPNELMVGDPPVENGRKTAAEEDKRKGRVILLPAPPRGREIFSSKKPQILENDEKTAGEIAAEMQTQRTDDNLSTISPIDEKKEANVVKNDTSAETDHIYQNQKDWKTTLSKNSTGFSEFRVTEMPLHRNAIIATSESPIVVNATKTESLTMPLMIERLEFARKLREEQVKLEMLEAIRREQLGTDDPDPNLERRRQAIEKKLAQLAQSERIHREMLAHNQQRHETDKVASPIRSLSSAMPCETMRRFVRWFRVDSPREWIRQNCQLAKRHFPNASCEQIEALLSKCVR
ncbi:hypothetical protein niasHT_016331 [Heterodera trifolii]|uniref:aECM cysteine-cradle domain-containing protein n=1 Tax=Heterodera trifolii TaxID=157864 RepID=A0ABD2KYV2_9BILA